MNSVSVPKIHIGCCGWPVARSGYFQNLPTVEINSTFYNPPKMATAQSWVEEAPEGFVFSLRAWQLVTHPPTSPSYERLSIKLSDKALARCGHFKETSEVEMGWERSQALARVLKAKFLLFQTPSSFYPNANHLRDMYRFFKKIPRGEIQFVWEPRGGTWEPKTIRKVCEDLGLIHGVDPLASQSMRGSARYFRLHGVYENGRADGRHEFSETELRRVAEQCADRPTYIYFDNRSMWRDARRFQELVRGNYVRDLRAL